MSQLRIENREVTPEEARQWFEGRSRNREFNLGRAKKYLRAMERGHWQLNGETIIFDSMGRLTDGQHRMWALGQHGKPLPFILVFDIELQANPTIDSGATRSLHDRVLVGALDLPLTKDQSKVASYLCPRHGRDEYDLIEFSAKHFKSIGFAVEQTQPHVKALSTQPVQAAITRAYYHVAHDRLERFCRVLMGGVPEAGTEDETAFVLRSDILEHTGTRQSNRARKMVFKKTLRALEAFHEGEVLKIIRGLREDIFPLPE